MLILEIAAGIVCAVLILAFWEQILLFLVLVPLGAGIGYLFAAHPWVMIPLALAMVLIIGKYGAWKDEKSRRAAEWWEQWRTQHPDDFEP